MGSIDLNSQGVNTNVALIVASASTATITSATQTNLAGAGVVVVLKTTAIGTGSVTLTINGITASGVSYLLLSGAAVVTNTTNVYTVYPGLTAVANVTATNILPSTWNVVVTANNANAATYTVDTSVVE